MGAWQFFQDEFLGMKWLNRLIGNVLSLLGLDIDGRLGGSVQFFLYDVIKITVLLCLLIFVISYIQSYFPPERSKKILGRFHGIGANIISALLGTVTPFCSCSSIPLFIGFTSAGLPLGVTFSFLISSPMVDLGSLVLLMSVFGAKVAVIYVLVGLAIAVAGGTVIEKLHMEKYVESFILSAGSVDIESPVLTKAERAEYAKAQVLSTFKKVFPYILAGVGIGAVIHNWIPESWIAAVLGSNNPFGVLLATLVGVPMYADIFGTIPVAEALLAKARSLAQSCLYDGGHNAESAIHHYAAKGRQTQTAGFVCRRLYGRHHSGGVLVQRVSVHYYLIQEAKIMGLFSKSKKEETTSCCCGGCTPEAMAQAETEKPSAGIKVLGSGCTKCSALELAAREALAELGMDTEIEHVTDFARIAAYGVMTTPALVVDGKVVSYGKVLKKDEAKALIQKVRG